MATVNSLCIIYMDMFLCGMLLYKMGDRNKGILCPYIVLSKSTPLGPLPQLQRLRPRWARLIVRIVCALG